MSALWTGDELRGRFEALSAFLQEHRALWWPAPFLDEPTDWPERWPEVAAWIAALRDDEIEAYEANPGEMPGPPALRAWIAKAEALGALGAWPEAPLPSPPLGRWEEHHQVKARKWAQIERFAAAVWPGLPDQGPLVDWCAGKAHLGRTLRRHGGPPVRALEWNATLATDGAALATAQGVDGLDFCVADATSAAAAEVLQNATGAVALHACGQLTDRLLAGAAGARLPWVAVAPCCYWRLGAVTAHAPRSRAAQARDLGLDLSRLHLACNEEVTGSPRLYAERRRNLAWRLGLDALLREGAGQDARVPLPGGIRALLPLPFADFCAQAARHLALPLPARWDPAAAEQEGWRRMRAVRARGLVRAPFRRLLELWLALDRALYLLESGYTVSMGTFCAPQLTPRNVLIVATQAPPSAAGALR